MTAQTIAANELVEEARVPLDVWLAAYKDRSDTDLARADPDDDLLTFGHLRTILATITRLTDELAGVKEALRPFADCCEYIDDDESDEEWAKFRLLVKHYRLARALLGGRE